MTEGRNTLVINLWESAATVLGKEYDLMQFGDCPMSYSAYTGKVCLNVNYPDEIEVRIIRCIICFYPELTREEKRLNFCMKHIYTVLP